MSYPGTDVFLICADLGYREATCLPVERLEEHIQDTWYAEILHHGNQYRPVPIVLVGTKSDLRDDPGALEARGRGVYQPEDYRARARVETAARRRRAFDQTRRVCRLAKRSPQP